MARTKQTARKSAGNLNQENKKQQAVLATPTSEPKEPNMQGGNVTTSTSLLGGGFTSKADRKRKRAASHSDSDNPLSLRAFETPRASRIKQEPVNDDESVVEIPDPKMAVTQPKKKVKVEPVRDEEELNPLDALEKALETPMLPAIDIPGRPSWFASDEHSDYDPALSDPPAISAPSVTKQTAEKEPITSDGLVTSVITPPKTNGKQKAGEAQPSLADLNNNPKTKKQLKEERKEAEETQKQPKEQGQEAEDRGDRPPRRAAAMAAAKVRTGANGNWDAITAAARGIEEINRERRAAVKAAEKIRVNSKKARKERQQAEMRRHMQKKWSREKVVNHVHHVIGSLALEKLRQCGDLGLVEESLDLALKAVRDEQKVMDGAAPQEQERLEGEVEAREAQIKKERKARKQVEQRAKKARDEVEKQAKKAKKIERTYKKAMEHKEEQAEKLANETKAIEKEMEELSKKIKKEKVDGPKKIKKEAKVMVKQEPRE